ncbi:MAG: preprotein translocase subunit SecA [Spirochaetaceae bacterium 4572_59]|nr:MAG: preprotein translocase subunit SecA [Spirochaetaceae bacterium 4572_59]
MVNKILTLILGSKQDKDIKQLLPILHAINEREQWALNLPAEAFKEQTSLLKKRLSKGETLDEILPEAFALCREAARRTLGERPYDVQLLGGIVLHQGKIMEMKTGEGKTLSSVAPAYLNALAGKGVHIITVNDYLASRDAAWMKPVYDYMGISVGVILSEMDPERRQLEYAKDITFGTNNEFGFDYLRDNMRWSLDKKAQKNHPHCIIDEIDSILIDEARTPLIISGAVQDDTSKFSTVNQLVSFLKECEKDPETGDYPLEDPITGIQPKGDFKLDEKSKKVVFTDEGMNDIESLLQTRKLIQGSLFEEENFEYIHYFTQAMKAHHLFHNDVDYVIQDGAVQIVDEFTGRVLTGRRYSDGLHQAIEAKENIKIAKRNRTLASITFQNFFRMYDKISGMTGTADTEAREFGKIYGLEVVVIPTNRPLNRKDEDDVIYLNEDYKFNAICDEIARVHKTGQPILVGTVSVDKSEKLAVYLRRKGVPFEILNAKNHHREALIIAEAGAKGSVTIATNMAGRGTDIKLGGNPESRARRKAGSDATEEQIAALIKEETVKWRVQNEEVRQLGGLYVLGSERHESRRIDNQLRGRSGRQGDPGYSQFFISLDDDLMRLFGGEKFKNTMTRLGMEGDEPLHHALINRSLEKAQKRVEDRNYEIRKHLLDYDDVLSKQRVYIYQQRDEILSTEDLTDKIQETGVEIVGILLDDYKLDKKKAEEEALPRLLTRLKDNFNYPVDENAPLITNLPEDQWEAQLIDFLKDDLQEKKDMVGSEQLNQFIRFEYLKNLDNRWQEHLESLEALREAVYLRSYAQKNPLVEYKNEGFQIFDQLIDDMRITLARKIYRVKVRKAPEDRYRSSASRQKVQATHGGVSGFAAGKSGERSEANSRNMQIRRTTPKVGRNEPCPCGSGKKYKNCCGS